MQFMALPSRNGGLLPLPDGERESRRVALRVLDQHKRDCL
jgi:hypothetical protein